MYIDIYIRIYGLIYINIYEVIYTYVYIPVDQIRYWCVCLREVNMCIYM